MKPARVTLQPSFFNDSSLLKSRDFTEVEPGHIVHWILAFNTFLSFGWVELYKAAADKISTNIHRKDDVETKKLYWIVPDKMMEMTDRLSSANGGRGGENVDIFDNLAYNLCFFMWCQHRLEE